MNTAIFRSSSSAVAYDGGKTGKSIFILLTLGVDALCRRVTCSETAYVS